jgi:hypothetical protein
LGLGALVLDSGAYAADVSGQVIGTTPTAITVKYPGVIASNLSTASSSTSAAHSHEVARRYTCAYDPSGRTQACEIVSMVFDEFLTSKTCAGRTACAMLETSIYGAKHKKDLLDVLGRYATVITIAQWAWEAYNWCINSAGLCGPIVGSGMCEIEDYSCTNGVLITNLDLISTGAADGSLTLQGNGEHALTDDMGSEAFPNGLSEAYDAPYGYGTWGVMYEIPFCMGLGPLDTCP